MRRVGQSRCRTASGGVWLSERPGAGVESLERCVAGCGHPSRLRHGSAPLKVSFGARYTVNVAALSCALCLALCLAELPRAWNGEGEAVRILRQADGSKMAVVETTGLRVIDTKSGAVLFKRDMPFKVTFP